MKKNDQEELNRLLHQLSLDKDQADEMVRDIEAGEECLNQCADPSLPPQVKNHILQTIQQTCSRRRQRRWAIRITQAAAGILLVIGISLMIRQSRILPPPEEPLVARTDWEWLDHEEVIFEAALAEDEYETSYDVDDISLTEWMWTQIQENEGEGSVRKEYRYENSDRHSNRSFRSGMVS